MSDTNRRTGRTTRMLWRALLAASEKPNARVAVVAHSGAWARDLAEKAWRMLPGGLNGDMRFDISERRIELPNGSQLVFFTTCPEDYGDESWRIGRPDLQVFEDHYVTEVMPHARLAMREDVVRRRARELGVEHLLRTEEEISKVREAVEARRRKMRSLMTSIDVWREQAEVALTRLRQVKSGLYPILVTVEEQMAWRPAKLERDLAHARERIEALLREYWDLLP